jgi:hypothetical protein
LHKIFRGRTHRREHHSSDGIVKVGPDVDVDVGQRLPRIGPVDPHIRFRLSQLSLPTSETVPRSEGFL